MGPPCGPHDGWKIHAGRLYCTINAEYMTRFAGLGLQGIADADARWTTWYGGAASGPINTGCFPGPTLDVCVNTGRPFPNRTHNP